MVDLSDDMDKKNAEDGGDSAGGNFFTGGAGGPDHGGSAGGIGSTFEAKGPHCMIRPIGILCDEHFHPIVTRTR